MICLSYVYVMFKIQQILGWYTEIIFAFNFYLFELQVVSGDVFNYSSFEIIFPFKLFAWLGSL